MSDFKKFCIDEKLSPVQIVGARKAWQEQQAIIDNLRSQLNNMEQCYIEKKKQVEAVEHVLGCAMIGPKEVFQYADRIGKALRGEHE